jgi:hypothetical protein
MASFAWRRRIIGRFSRRFFAMISDARARVQLTGAGRKIVLLRWLGNDPVIGWWSRVFDAT